MVTLFIPQIMDEWENEWSYTVKVQFLIKKTTVFILELFIEKTEP